MASITSLSDDVVIRAIKTCASLERRVVVSISGAAEAVVVLESVTSQARVMAKSAAVSSRIEVSCRRRRRRRRTRAGCRYAACIANGTCGYIRETLLAKGYLASLARVRSRIKPESLSTFAASSIRGQDHVP